MVSTLKDIGSYFEESNIGIDETKDYLHTHFHYFIWLQIPYNLS